MTEAEGKLYLVPTPIGNLSDISRRALEVIEMVDLVACEDTRHTGSLLARFDLKKKLISYHDFNEAGRARDIIEKIRVGQSVAVITDAGSPGISDPAFRVVRSAIENDIEIVPLPGPTALIPALTASGLPTDRFFFEGFLPPKKGARQKRLHAVKDYPHTLIFYESPHRIEKTLLDMVEVLGERPACLAREISKKFEQFLRGNLIELKDAVVKKAPKGEMVIIVGGAGKRDKVR